MRNQDRDIFVLYDDNSYKFIDNTDASILSYAKKDHVKFMFFPVYGKNSTRYYKEDAKVIISPIQITIDAQLILCTLTDDGMDYGYPNKIHLTANDIASSYSLIGSLYNMLLCCVELETEYDNTSPHLINFEINIKVDGCDYKLDTDLFVNTIHKLAESGDSYAKSSMVYESDFNAISIQEVIDYIEHTITYKNSTYDALNGGNEDYLIFDNNEYIKYSSTVNFISPSEKALLLMTTGTPLYMTVLFKEYLMINGYFRYDLAYCMYEELDTPDGDNAYLDEHDLTCDILGELDNYMYRITRDDILHMYKVNQFLFMITGIADVTDILMSKLEATELYDNNNINVCYSCSIVEGLDHNQHSISLGCSITSNLIATDNLDFLNMITSTVKLYLRDHA